MNEEQKIQAEISRLCRIHPEFGTIDIALHFNKSYFWAYSRRNPRYMTRKVRDMLLESLKSEKGKA